MARCLRCKAGNEWIEGAVKPLPSKIPARVRKAARQLMGSEEAIRGTDAICDDALTLARWITRISST